MLSWTVAITNSTYVVVFCFGHKCVFKVIRPRATSDANPIVLM